MAASAGKQLFRDYVKVWQTGNLPDLAHLLHEDYVGHPSQGDRDSIGLRERIVAFRNAYSNAIFTIDDQFAAEDRVATRLTVTARRVSDGQPVVLFGLNICRIADGRIIEEWMAWESQPSKSV